MKLSMITLVLILLQAPTHAKIQQDDKNLSNNITSSCKNNKDIKVIFAQYSNDKQSEIIDSYCVCRTRLLFDNLTYKEVQNVHNKKQHLSEDLFIKLIIDCTKHIEKLIK